MIVLPVFDIYKMFYRMFYIHFLELCRYIE